VLPESFRAVDGKHFKDSKVAVSESIVSVIFDGRRKALRHEMSLRPVDSGDK